MTTKFHDATRDLAKAACHSSGSSSVLMLNQDAIYESGDSLAQEVPGVPWHCENPATTKQTPPSFLESKSLLEQNCCRFRHPFMRQSSSSND